MIIAAPLNGKEPAKCLILNGALGGTRTPDTLVRSQVLYPAELRAQWGVDLITNGGPYKIRTYDTEVKSLLLYRLS